MRAPGGLKDFGGRPSYGARVGGKLRSSSLVGYAQVLVAFFFRRRGGSGDWRLSSFSAFGRLARWGLPRWGPWFGLWALSFFCFSIHCGTHSWPLGKRCVSISEQGEERDSCHEG